MTSIAVEVTPAPLTPLNLRFCVTYAPRVPTPPWVGYFASEVEPHVYEVFAYEAGGSGAVLFRGALAETFHRFAMHLRMDV